MPKLNIIRVKGKIPLKMKVLKSKENKTLIIIMISIQIIGIILFNAIIQWQNQQKTQIVNQTIQNIVGEVKKTYPEIKEEEIIKILNNEENQEKGKEILKRYGIDWEKENIIISLEEQSEKNTIQIIILNIIILLISVFVILYFFQRRNKKIEQLIQYMEQIMQKNYELKIENNTEDELTHLRNEIYKITILLKEQADTEQRERKQLSKSISDISHQLKTPLTSISIMLDNMIENPSMEEKTKEQFIHEIRRQIEWISWLVISLLKLSRLDANVEIFQQEEIKIEQLIQNTIQNLAIPIEIKNQEIIIQGDKKAKIIGDYKWQLEAITNVVKNAIEHNPENKKIWITLEENSLFTKIVIKDQGPGIAKEDIKHIFERFYKGRNSSENSIGIGLALAKSIIEKQNGYISCYSKLKEGTIFEIKYMK